MNTKSTVVMERDSSGVVNTPDGFIAQVPVDRSMLSIFGGSNQPIKHEGNYKKDGWIYDTDNNRICKWFTFIGSESLRIWEPIIHDLPTLEARRWKMYEKRNITWKRQWESFGIPLMEAGGACFKHPRNEGYLYLYKPVDNGVSGSLLNVRDFDSKSKLFNEEIGLAYWKSFGWAMEIGKRFWKFCEALDWAIGQKYRGKYYDSKKQFMRIIINGRDYWYTSERHVGFCKFSWPENATMISVEE